ncbi:LytR family transcriptional regulator [Actinomadura syzygii]|uniref:LytR family transcriptional regulator n=2 Tax=Actinomadura syzygii TaxID=1427538 RepID=A0A5D0U9D0_9ACTN|nr:LytR family transcriptional regulator [Actinomadura syzygii]
MPGFPRGCQQKWRLAHPTGGGARTAVNPAASPEWRTTKTAPWTRAWPETGPMSDENPGRDDLAGDPADREPTGPTSGTHQDAEPDPETETEAEPVAATADADADAEDVPAKGRRRSRRILRWTAIGAALVLLVGGAGTAWLYHDLMGGIEKKHVDDQLGADRPKKLNKSLNILLIGSDTRDGDNARYGAAAGMSGARSDTAIILHLSPNRDQAVGISFPRDSMVKIPQCKKEKGGTVPAQFGMLNAAFAYAGPTCTWKTLESLTGIHIDHFVQVDFSGFKRMVDALGGVQICVDKPVNDPRAELYLKAGKQTVKGEQALGYVRARYSLGNGSDLERIERQQKFMAAVVDKATSGSVLSDPAKTYKFLKAATKSVTTDDDLDLSAMRKLADGLKGMSAGQVRFVTVPVERYAPDPNRVQWNQELAKPLFEAVKHDNDLPAEPAKPVQAKQAPPAPGKVNVTVVDAGGPDPLVRRVVRQLRQRGFKVAKKVEKGAAAPESRIVYGAAAEAQASALARDVPDALLTADAAAPADGVRLVIGTNGLRLAPPAINKIGGGVQGGQNPCRD